MLLTIVILLVVCIWIYFFMHQKRFGGVPSGERLARMKNSPHYKRGRFHNISHTPSLTEGANFFSVMKEFFFNRKQNRVPPTALPSIKTNLHHLSLQENVLVWFGHSSYFMQLDGKRYLVDPVLTGSASPIKSTTKSFPGTDIYKPEDIPDIDYLFITHDHWDHLDHDTLMQLKPRIKKIITALGVGAHLEAWGYEHNRIIELDWNESATPENGITIHSVTARHFSGRSFKRNTTLWSSFVLITPTKRIFIGGDSGYDNHFKITGERFGPFDLAILENGQYNKFWKFIHMMPEEVVQASIDLNADKLLPVHWSKFSLSTHAWQEPIERVVKEATQRNLQLLHPIIGEKINLEDEYFNSTQWWKEIT